MNRPTDEEATKQTRELIDALLRSLGIEAGMGPPFAYIEIQPDKGCVPFQRVLYTAYEWGGNRYRETENFKPRVHYAEDGLRDLWIAIIRELLGCLTPNRMLLWRTAPMVEFTNGEWHAYFRCLQVEGNPQDGILIRWRT